MPRDVAKRIVTRCARNEIVVVVPRRGKPSRVFAFDTYRRMQEQPKTVKPWAYRKSSRPLREPLGGVDGTVLAPLKRENIYD